MVKCTRFVAFPVMFLAFVVGGANGQQPRAPYERQPLKPSAVEGPLKGVPPSEAPTVEELVTKLETLRKQKAAIELQEKAIIDELRKAKKQLDERLSKLGVLPVSPQAVDAPLAIFPGSAPPRQK